MKKDQLEKRLNFKKFTVSNLNGNDMGVLLGGHVPMQTCDPKISTCFHSCGYTNCEDTTCCSTGDEERLFGVR